ncbi:hypothetical protein [Selenomonas sp. FC4001]|uniref:hypothetical protein n=1 Tax=Selenomonas sp. FC4001 TaxID=1408313 RepID=UPI0018CC784F|nr:hypothetical protein [Selenomonas sp. FC4001]
MEFVKATGDSCKEKNANITSSAPQGEVFLTPSRMRGAGAWNAAFADWREEIIFCPPLFYLDQSTV